jgi:H+/Cl- antiporter ClcA
VLFGLCGGACLGLLAVLCPLTLGDGQWFVAPLIYTERARAGLAPNGTVVNVDAHLDAASAGQNLGVPVLLATLLAKVAAFSLAVASGYEGGVSFASMYLGTLLGLIVWIGADRAGLGVEPHVCCAIGATSMMTGTMNTPVTAIVISMVIFQLVGDETCLLILGATVVNLALVGTGVLSSLRLSNPCKGPLK